MFLQITFRHFLEYFPVFVKRRSDYVLVINFLWLTGYQLWLNLIDRLVSCSDF